MEGGLSKLLKAAWDTVFEFPMNDPACVMLESDGIVLNMKQNYGILTDFEFDDTAFPFEIALPMIQLSNDGTAPYVAFFGQNLETFRIGGGTVAYAIGSPNYFCKIADDAPVPIDLNFSGKLRFQLTDEQAVKVFRLVFWRVPVGATVGGGYTTTILFTTGAMVQDEIYEYDFATMGVITANPGDRFFFEFERNPFASPGALSKYKFIDESKPVVSLGSRFKTTSFPCWPRMALYREIIKRITGSADNAISQLCTDNNNLLITCGDAIRNIVGATLKTSLASFFKDNDATFMAGMAITLAGIELEERQRYYTEVDEIDLGSVVDFEIKPATDLMFNTFKFGHQKQDIEDVNGKYDPNGNNQFTGPITKVVKEYNMVSPYKAGPYEIEILRINLAGKITTDNNSDNDVFVIAAKATQKAYAATKTNPEDFASSALIPFDASSGDDFSASGGIDEFTYTGTVAKTVTITLAAVMGAGFGRLQLRKNGITIDSNPFDATTGAVSVSASLMFMIQPGDVIDTRILSPIDPYTVNLATLDFVFTLFYELDRPAYTTLEGVPNDTIFNLPFLTPKTMLFRHGRWIRSMNAGLDTEKIKFASGKDNNNTLLKTVLAGFTTDEDKDEPISSLGDYMFLPWYFTFKTEVPADIPDLIESNPNRSFKFTDEYGQVWRGFSRLIGIAPNDYTPQEFKMLATPNNNITLLIHG